MGLDVLGPPPTSPPQKGEQDGNWCVDMKAIMNIFIVMYLLRTTCNRDASNCWYQIYTHT